MDSTPVTKSILYGNDYKTHFDAKFYLNTYHSEVQPFSSKLLQMVHELVATAQIPSGGRLLNVGCGPSIYAVISPGSRCSEIVFSDFAPQNVDEVRKWANNDPDAHDWRPYFEHVCQLEGRRDEWEARQDHIRQATKHVVSCDVHQENPLAPLVFEPFDVIVSSLCLESACLDETSFRSAVKNVVSLLKPGGLFFLDGLQEKTSYEVGNMNFHKLPINNKIIKSAFKAADLTNLRWSKDNKHGTDNNANTGQRAADFGLFAVRATKVPRYNIVEDF
ncbi:nicotinamide N-methyltransferase-like [Lineus longissimus]|uniref:nicotinamide N-methyltransferase-like n=1 Tax=Lineus longissimus TaxID=88925 RepID=UPI002B4EF199